MDGRLRRATPADADLLAWGLNEAAGGLFDVLLGRRASHILASIMSQPTHAFSFEHAVLFEMNAVPVGMCQGFPYGTPEGVRAFVHAAKLRTFRAAIVAGLGWPVFAAMSHHSPGEWYLQAIAVRANARGMGVGATLLANATSRAIRAGCDALTLDVDAKNVRAKALYEREGFQERSLSPRAPLAGGARVYRMSKPVHNRDQ